MKPEVSVIVATYNYGCYLAGALESIQAQTFANWEAVIVDDGSTDGTSEVVRKFSADSRIHYIKTENGGQPSAENKGIRASRGSYLAFLDADDLWFPEKLEKQIKLFDADPALGIAYSRRLTIDPRGIVVERCNRALYRGKVLKQLFRNNFVCFSSSMVNRKVFEAVGAFNEECRHASDYEFWLRAARMFTFDYVDEPLVKYRKGHANLTSRGDRQLTYALKIMDEFIKNYPREIPPSEARRAYAETYLHMAQATRENSRNQALSWLLRSIGLRPWRREAWSDLLTLYLPENLKARLRRLLRSAVSPSP